MARLSPTWAPSPAQKHLFPTELREFEQSPPFEAPERWEEGNSLAPLELAVRGGLDQGARSPLGGSERDAAPNARTGDAPRSQPRELGDEK